MSDTAPQPPREDPPVLIGCVSCGERLVGALQAQGHAAAPIDASSDTDHGVAPRLVVVKPPEAPGDRAAECARALASLQQRWPLVPVLVWAVDADGPLVRDALRAGAADVIFDSDPEAVVRSVTQRVAEQRVLPMVDQLAKRRVRVSRFEGLLSRSHRMWDLFETCARVAPTDANVLICGETGTGKELFARALHRRSRRAGRFVALNCSAIPEHLVESQLFGHERGAFTGAYRDQPGVFRLADRGSIFLDEIGDMPEAAQQSLLRVLQEKRVRSVGGVDEIDVDTRVIAATHVPLEREVKAGRFRGDLFYRLDVIRLEIPPLRERPEDIVYLFGYFLKRLAKHYEIERPSTDAAFLQALSTHAWPGNVRELENFTERLLLAKRKKRVRPADFERFIRNAPEEESVGIGTPSPRPEIDLSKGLDANLRSANESIERLYLEAALRENKGRIGDTAHQARVSRRTLQRKLAAHGIDKNRYKEA